LLSLTVYLFLRRLIPDSAAAGAALVLQCLPPVQLYSRMVMAEIPAALMILWTVLLFGRFLRTQTVADSAKVGLLISVAILTQYTAIVLTALPLIGVIVQRRLGLIRRPALWLSPVIFLCLCAPWYLASPNSRHRVAARAALSGLAAEPAAHASQAGVALHDWAGALIGRTRQFGIWPAVVVLAVVLAAFGCLLGSGEISTMDPALGSCAGVAIAFAICAVVIPGWLGRHLFPLTPFAVILTAVALNVLFTHSHM